MAVDVMEPEAATAARQVIEQQPAEQSLARPRATVLPPAPRQAQASDRVIVAHSDDLSLLFTALAKAQGEFEDVTKTKTARIQSRREGGAQYAYEYETLADVIRSTKKALSDNGLAVMQFPFVGSQTVTLRTMLAHASGQWVSNDMFVAIDSTQPQAVASGITYLQRYARKAILGIAADDEDDDAGAATSQRQAPPQPARRVSEQQQAKESPEKKQPQPTRAPVGAVAELVTSGNATRVVLSSGYEAVTRDPEIVKGLGVLKEMGATVELVTKPSSDPAKYLPVIVETTVRRKEQA